jgi:hypothetical protein
MLLLAVLVLTTTVSADGSISGVYRASLRLAEQTAGGASKELTGKVNELVGTEDRLDENNANKSQNSSDQKSAPQNTPDAAPQEQR